MSLCSWIETPVTVGDAMARRRFALTIERADTEPRRPRAASSSGSPAAASAASPWRCLLAARGGPRPRWPSHHPPKAKRVVQLFMAGAASHIDLFDYKPELVKRHGQPSDFGEQVEAFQNGLGPWLRPVWDFRPHGQCGKRLGEVVADLGGRR